MKSVLLPTYLMRACFALAALAASHSALSQSTAALPATSETSAAACDDFFQHVNGAWMKRTTIPAERARWGTFNELSLANRTTLIDALAAIDPKTSPSLSTPGKQKAFAHYRAGLALDAIERAKFAPIANLLSEIDVAKNSTDIAVLMGRLALHGVAAPILVSVSPDGKDKSRHLVQLSQSGLGLPDRDDYLVDSDITKRYREAYAIYRSALLGNEATNVYELELALAKVSRPRAEQRDPNRQLNYFTLETMNRTAPGVSWRAFFDANEIKTFGNAKDEFNVSQPEFVAGVAKLVNDISTETWKAYFRLRLIDAAAPFLHREMRDAEFAYRTTALTGVATDLPRNERVIDMISGRVGSEPLAEGLGQFFVDRAFPPAAKTKAVTMVNDIKAALRERLEVIEWMSASTRKNAIAKLDAMTLKIGYPDRWKTYHGLEIREDDFAGNWLRARVWEQRSRISRVGQPVDRNAWFSSPHIVNAFAGSHNDIVFPAGILQAPFFDPNASDAQNYGAIGMVIGHEITHHFDDRGRQFDSLGNLKDWWTPEDAENYRARAAKVVAQFDRFEPVPGTRVNGTNTQGENISDLGGIAIAYAGFQRAAKRSRINANAPQSVTGSSTPLSPNQVFFSSFAQMWRELHRTESLVNQLRTGNHSPGRYRVNGPLANFKPFAEAFNCKPGQGFVRPENEMITIW